MIHNVKTSELHTGDIVHTGIGRVELVGPRKQTPGHNAHGPVTWFDGRILDYRPTAGSDHRWIGRMNVADGRPATQWSVQGNDLARWSVENR
jgi:hypothetical protein